MNPERSLTTLLLCCLSFYLFAASNPLPVKKDKPIIVEVPFRLAGNLIIVKGNVDGKEGNFIIDTGAPTLVLNKNKLRYYSNSTRYNSSGVTGSIPGMYEKGVRRVKLAEAEFPNIDALVMDLSHLEKIRDISILGLIGYQLLKKYEVVFDFENRHLILYRLGKKGRALADSEGLRLAPSDSVSFRLVGHLPCIKGQLDGKKTIFGIDSGAEINLINNELKGAFGKAFSPDKNIDIYGLGKRKVNAETGILKYFWIEGIKFDEMTAIMANMNHFQPIKDFKLDGLLGHDFLRQRKLSINFRKKKVFFWNPKQDDAQLASKYRKF